MKKTLALTAALASLALAGCSVGKQSVEPVPSPTATPSAPAVESTAPSVTPTSSATHVPKDTGIKFAGATGELKDLAAQKYAQWDEYNEKDSHRFRGAYKAGHVVMLPKVDPGKIGEWAKILEWSAPASDHILVRIEGNNWTKQDLKVPGDSVACALVQGSNKGQIVVFTTENGKTKGAWACNLPLSQEDLLKYES